MLSHIAEVRHSSFSERVETEDAKSVGSEETLATVLVDGVKFVFSLAEEVHILNVEAIGEQVNN
jgi:hypothetical protein